MFNNITCEKFKQNISEIIANSQLPPVVVYYILKDSLHEVEDLCKEAIQQELSKINNENQQEEAE